MWVYVATPYRAFPGSSEDAWKEACRASAPLARLGIPFFTPIAQGHPVTEHGALKLDDTQWLLLDQPLLRGALALLVVRLPGWDKSQGIAIERKIAEQERIPIFEADPDIVPPELRQLFWDARKTGAQRPSIHNMRIARMVLNRLIAEVESEGERGVSAGGHHGQRGP